MRLSLLGRFDLSDAGISTNLPKSASRVIALLAIADRVMARTAVAGTLWPDASESHALASLRSTITRLDAPQHSTLIVADGISLSHMTYPSTSVRRAN